MNEFPLGPYGPLGSGVVPTPMVTVPSEAAIVREQLQHFWPLIVVYLHCMAGLVLCAALALYSRLWQLPLVMVIIITTGLAARRACYNLILENVRASTLPSATHQTRHGR